MQDPLLYSEWLNIWRRNIVRHECRSFVQQCGPSPKDSADNPAPRRREAPPNGRHDRERKEAIDSVVAGLDILSRRRHGGDREGRVKNAVQTLIGHFPLE